MAKGVRIAKPGYKVSDSSDKIYVDTTTPLFKIFLSGSGTLVSDGTNVTWRGKYGGTTTAAGNYSITIPHPLGYPPLFIAYMDAGPGSNRTYLTNASIAGVVGGIVPFAEIDDKNLTISALTNSVSFPLPAPFAGDYGFFFYIFYDKAKS